MLKEWIPYPVIGTWIPAFVVMTPDQWKSVPATERIAKRKK